TSTQVGGTGTATWENSSGQVTESVTTISTSVGELTTVSVANPQGVLSLAGVEVFLSASQSPGMSEAQADAASLEGAVNSVIGLETPTGSITNTWLTSISVVNLANLSPGQQPFTGTAPLVIGGADFEVAFPTVNDDGVF